MSVRLYSVSIKTAQPIEPKFLWDLALPQERIKDLIKLSKIVSNKIRFLKIQKIYSFT